MSSPKTRKDSRKDVAPDAGDPAAVFLRAMQRVQQGLLRQLVPVLEEEHGIDFRLYFILRYIENGAIHPGAISKLSYLPNSVVTRHLDQLVDRGLLERSLDSEDSRRIKLTLTKEGHRIAREAHRTICGLLGGPMAKLTPAARDSFLETLTKLADDIAP